MTGHEEEESEGLALLMADIQHTAGIVQASTSRLKARTSDGTDGDLENDAPLSPPHHGHNSSIDKLYINVMKDLQFGKLTKLSYQVLKAELKLPAKRRTF